MDEIYETQPERTDLPLVVMPVIIESMIEPFEKNFELFKDIARVRMYRISRSMKIPSSHVAPKPTPSWWSDSTAPTQSSTV